MNGKTLFQFNNESPVTPSGKLTKEENATEPCPVLPQSVKNILEVMRNQLRHIEPEQLKTMGNNTLQVTMISQYNQGQFTGAFCKFTIDGQSSFSFHPTKDIWTANGPDASSTMRPWEKNRELRQGLRRLLKGDFRHCYQKFLTLWRQTPRPTKKAWDTTHPTSAVQSRNMTWVVILCIAGLIFIKLVT
ncbi:retinoic acid early transcript 1E [Mus pahari]|uniref:retinoic acid early transcript 1E n=1 Tax=Mus pahari TaxID=10093 RepID=UPI001114C826|nr:retinoic acid early transcript 1E [Mus pahari]